MGLRRLCFLLSVTSVLSFAGCGDNEHFRFHDAGTDTNGSGSDASIDTPDALTCTAPQTKCGDTCVNLQTDTNNCGACGTMCPANNTCQTDGSSTICCPSGQTNCGGTCVDLTTTHDHCGTCATACTSSQTCDNGTCCGSGTTVCSTPNGDQCFDLQTDEGHCGACANAACAANQTCDGGICCDNGKINCGGTCVDPNSDEAHCGGCVGTNLPGTVCSSTQSCEGGICCTTGQLNCSGTCTDITTDTHCGSCTTSCSSTQDCTASSSNTGPQCCTTGFNNCSGTCSNPLTDNMNCGGCGITCGAGESCSDGKCCGPGLTNCGGGPTGVCVDLINDAGHCGTCSTTCSGGTPLCSGASCSSQCGTGETPCSGNCVFTNSDHENCGGCGLACAANQVCSGGTCTTTCTSGTNCNGSCVDIQTDPNHCGSCSGVNSICPAADECVAGMCQFDCPGGELLCDPTNPDPTKWCSNVLQDEAHCSTNPASCGVACGAGQTCDQGVCCDAQKVNCGGVCKDLTTNGSCGACNTTCTGTNTCQTSGTDSRCCPAGQINCGSSNPTQCFDPLSDENNCGGCGNICGGSQTCDQGLCCDSGTVYTPDTAGTTPACCRPGFLNCGGTCFDPSTTDTHCGTCANNCAASGLVCSGGQCATQCTGAGNNTLCGVCTNPQTDEGHCGTPGTNTPSCQVCPTGNPQPQCNSGVCQTCQQANPATPDECNKQCTNVLTDTQNCGACNQPCGLDQICTSGICCNAGESACGTTCVDFNVGVPQGDGTTKYCGTCGNTCSAGSTCTNGTCACPFGQESCSTGCKTLVTDRDNCGACNNKCTGNDACVSGSCVATCPAPLVKCGNTCVNPQDDNAHCGGCTNACTNGTACSAGLCVTPLGPFVAPQGQCIGGGPPISVPIPGQGNVCTGNLGAVAFTFGLCSRTEIGPLSQVLYTDAFDSTSGAYKSSCTTTPDCGDLHCAKSLDKCTTGTPGTQGNCPSGDICDYPVVCVGGTCVGGGVGVNGTVAPVASNTANTHVGGDFWVYGENALNKGLEIKGNTQVKQRFINDGSIDLAKTSRVWGTSYVKGPWTSGGNASMTMAQLFTQVACSQVPNSVTTTGCNQVAQWWDPMAGNTTSTRPPPPCGLTPATDGSLIPVKSIVDYFRDPAHNDNNSVTPPIPYDILDNPASTVRLDLPCGYYYFNQMNIGKDTTIVVHGRTALFVSGALRVSQKLILDLDPTATLDIFVGSVMNVSNIVELGSPAYPRRSRLYFGGSSCLGTGTCSNPSDCCSGVCTNNVCGAGGGGNLSQAISLSNGGFFNGLLWGGYGQFTHSNPLEMYGSIYAGYFDASGDTTVHYDIGATKTGEECPPPPQIQSCESCRDCGNQACVNHTCGACTSDAQCCAPLHCSAGVCKL